MVPDTCLRISDAVLHILYIHQYFATPRGATGTRSYEFARRWVRRGHRVTVVTSTAQLTSADVPGGDLSRRTSFEVEGVRVIALPVSYSQKMGRLGRIWAFVRFMFVSTWRVLREPKVDVVYATSTPLTVAVPALVRRWLRRTPFVFEVRDAWPDVPDQLGYLPGGPVLWMLRRFERLTYRCASHVIALSPGMKRSVLAQNCREERISVIPNCCDTDRFHPGIDGGAVRQREGWQGRLVCMHVGAIGMSNGLDFVIRVAERLRDEPE